MATAIISSVVGNSLDPEWQERLAGCSVEWLELDQWTAQKSRFVARTRGGEEVAVALKRATQLRDGDILHYDADRREALVVRLKLNEVLVIDLGGVRQSPMEVQRQRLFELGHAIGNQHWPAVFRGDKIYVPLTVDRKVMSSVMQTHRFEGISFTFQSGQEVIPYLAPHEIRRLFGGAEHHSHPHHEHR